MTTIANGMPEYLTDINWQAYISEANRLTGEIK